MRPAICFSSRGVWWARAGGFIQKILEPHNAAGLAASGIWLAMPLLLVSAVFNKGATWWLD